MKLPFRFNRRTLLITLIIAALGIGGASILRSRASNSTANAAPSKIELAAEDLAEVKAEAIASSLKLSGYLQPLSESVLTAAVEGRIEAVFVRPGEKVVAGQVLARMDNRDLAARLAEQQANLAASRAQLDLADKTHKRNEELQAKNFISSNSLDTSRSNLEAQKEALHARQAQVALARQALEKSVIRAPQAGIVAERAVQPGQHVGLNARLFSIVDLSELEFAATVPVSQVGAIRIGQNVQLTAEGSEAQALGRVERIAPTAETSTRMIPVYIRVKNTDLALKGGMSAQGEVSLAEAPATLTLPREALRREGKQITVLVANNGVVEQRIIETGLEDETRGRVEIKSGLKAGEIVILARVANLQPGQAITLNKPPASPSAPATPPAVPAVAK